MSTFDGFIHGFDLVSVDRFVAQNRDAKVFFLSHCHYDHMVGLSEIDETSPLPGPLYLSEVSSLFVNKRFPAIRRLEVLKIGDATQVIVNENECFTVTALPAGHCPGSVMFLFERPGMCALYTGDFRLSTSSIDQMCALKRFASSEARLDCLYYDSTFFTPDYRHFPSQRESVDAIIALSKQWLHRDACNVVALRPPANIGYEFIVTEMAKCLGQCIHVSAALYAEYSAIPELGACITRSIEASARIHLCAPEVHSSRMWRTKRCVCLASQKDEHICIIRPTAMKWKGWNRADAIHEKDWLSNCFFVCYSNHSSYSEISHLIEYLRPNDIKMNVLPDDIALRKRMMDELARILDKYGTSKNAAAGDREPLADCTFDIDWSQVKSQIVQFDDEIANTSVKRRRTASNRTL